MKASFIFPITARGVKNSQNPYLENFMNSLQDRFAFLNRNHPSGTGIFNIIRYVFKIRYVFLHWPENIPERKSGIPQTIFLLSLIPILKLLRVRIIYIFHNKISHTRNRYFLKKLIALSLIKASYRIITHAGDGVSYIRMLAGKPVNNIFFFPHPVIKEKIVDNAIKETDILIWGNIAPYKGIDRFLKKMAEYGFTSKWKVKIAGKASSEEYMRILVDLKSNNTEIINRFITEPELNHHIEASKVVLFPYHADSVLSSGAFAKTVVFPVAIIGPDCGSFRDFRDLSDVFTFQDEEQMFDLLSSVLSGEIQIIKRTPAEIAEKFSWESFAVEFLNNMN